MRGRELPLVLLALVLCQASRGPAAPAPASGGTVLAKMYPRGNHWAVGHLMGKKSTGEFPSAYEGGSLKQQLTEYVQWEDAARNLLDLIEAKRNRSPRPPQLLGNPQPIWNSEKSSNFKNVGSKCRVGRLSAPGSRCEERNPQLNGQGQ
ncbi:gastrin-releasing peptide isoform X2 [Tupaia chinensis]|uniref:gastrin-releasing peptide isoform X2 n=1 Tax=Tupaia chinensis TaxID=246437 RepID=UPI000FFB7107|nr:gastrin-releasing peptide isoform X2 [Tupaia chinensis]